VNSDREILLRLGAPPRPIPPLADDDARARILNDLDTTLVVEAAAGTGKTTALVGRIVAVVASGAATLDRIVAVTFTERAAGELKLRLREEIERARTAEQTPPEQRERLQASLEKLEEARIGTIHSFCAELLGERPIEAGIDPRFTVAPTDSADRLLHRAFELWFESELEQPHPGVRRILRRRGWQDSGGPRRMLLEAARKLADWRDFDSRWQHQAFDREAEIDALLARIDALGQMADEGGADDWLGKALAEFRRFGAEVKRLETVRGRDYDALEAELLGLRQRRSQGLWSWRGFGPEFGAYRRADVIAQRDALRTELDAFGERAGADLAPRLRDELFPVVESYQRLKQRAGQLDFMDLLLVARDLVRDNAAVRAELQARFSHIFVDEFQDTDPLQAEILMLLAADDPAARDWRQVRPIPGKLFIVGDPKQSIYRFRRADVALYQWVKRRLLDCGADLLHLTVSFRPTEELAKMVNAAFAPLMVESQTQAAYAQLNALRVTPATQPAVVALPVHAPYGDYGRIVNWRIEESTPQVVAAFVAWLIAHSGWTVTQRSGPDQRVPIAPRHICILFRRFDSFGGDVARGYMRALEARRIPHVLLGGSSFHEREEVEALRNALIAIERPDDELAVFATLRGPIFGLSDAALLSYRHQVPGSLHPFRRIPATLPEEAAAVGRALEVLRGLHRGRNRRPIADTIQEFLNLTRAHAGFAVWPTGEQALANLMRVLDKARRFEARGGISFRGFIDALEAEAQVGEAAEAKVVEEGTEGVRMMTVHAAKGLEFPVVILADPTCRETREPSRYTDPDQRLCAQNLAGYLPAQLLAHREEELRRDGEEATRVLYVAATRARDLFVVPVLSEQISEGWLQKLSEVLYPPQEMWRRPLAAIGPGCPQFGDDALVARPPKAKAKSQSVMPGLHQPRAGDHRVVWWDPNRLELDVQEAMGLRQVTLLQVDESGTASAAGRQAYARWCEQRTTVREQGARPMLAVEAVTALAAKPAAPAAAAMPIEIVALPKPDQRPHGQRFGTLVHNSLLQVQFDAPRDEIQRVVELQARILGAEAPESAAAVQAIEQALGCDVMRRARAAGGDCRRECAVLVTLADGTLAEGIADMAFCDEHEGELGWTVVDFKTDTDLQPRLSEYRAQVGIYMQGISRSTGLPARGILLWI
jgi:ATP-dependent helicase/nuclease subunit A